MQATGLPTREAVLAQIATDQKRTLNLQAFNHVLQTNRQPFDAEASRYAGRASSRVGGAYLMAAICPPLAIGLAVSAAVEYGKGGPARAQVAAHNARINGNTAVMDQSSTSIQVSQDALNAAQHAQATMAAHAAARQRAAMQLTFMPPEMG